MVGGGLGSYPSARSGPGRCRRAGRWRRPRTRRSGAASPSTVVERPRNEPISTTRAGDSGRRGVVEGAAWSRVSQPSTPSSRVATSLKSGVGHGGRRATYRPRRSEAPRDPGRSTAPRSSAADGAWRAWLRRRVALDVDDHVGRASVAGRAALGSRGTTAPLARPAPGRLGVQVRDVRGPPLARVGGDEGRAPGGDGRGSPGRRRRAGMPSCPATGRVMTAVAEASVAALARTGVEPPGWHHGLEAPPAPPYQPFTSTIRWRARPSRHNCPLADSGTTALSARSVLGPRFTTEAVAAPGRRATPSRRWPGRRSR